MRRPEFERFDRRRLRTAGLVAVLALVVAFAGWQVVRPKPLEITAEFPRAVGLYQGDDVRILGVAVGSVRSVERDGGSVRVRMQLVHGTDVPATASAVLIAPTLVSGRYVQLAPVYDSGPKLAEGAVIPKARTQVPVEFDELKAALQRFGTDLGPDAPDGSGPLGRALGVSADNLAGQGQSMHDTLTELSGAVGTLSAGRGDIFATVRNLAEFTAMLARTDRRMRSFADQMARLSEQLADSRVLLGDTVAKLNRVVPQVQAYLAENRPLVRDNLNSLEAVSTMLANRRQDTADILQVVPVTLSNTYNLYDPGLVATTGAMILPYQASPSQVVCWMFDAVGAAGNCGPAKAAAAPLDQAFGRTTTGGLGALLGGSR